MRLRLWRDRIEFGGVDEIDAACKGQIHLGMAFRFGVLLAPGHRAQADLGNKKIGPSETAFMHGNFSGWEVFARLRWKEAQAYRKAETLSKPVTNLPG